MIALHREESVSLADGTATRSAGIPFGGPSRCPPIRKRGENRADGPTCSPSRVAVSVGRHSQSGGQIGSGIASRPSAATAGAAPWLILHADCPERPLGYPDRS